MITDPDTVLPARVRNSTLVETLSRKLETLQPVNFDYWGQFNRLRKRVAADVTEISRLFPQFTPHDEELHLARLFSIADKMIGADRYERMNAAELFLLACGLYAHDWGMAVGAEELEFLRTGGVTVSDVKTFTPLDDEVLRLQQFGSEFGIRCESRSRLDDTLVRLYVRRTHAWRSGVRAKAFFQTVGSSVPQALELICQGHWLQFSELDDEMRFSSRFGVLGHTVNLRAIALYVRLVDLFDIADDRTPYAVWRFVAPEDPVARMEWDKHRSLSAVTFPVYGDGRSVRFDGRTDDPEVWAELQDLGRYCEEQIAGTLDLLARHPDSRHQLDIRKLEWLITYEKFKPINLRFEFHRSRMFDILANEIYQGDSHVFLRELLQNSIDAIATRRELVKQRSVAGGATRDVGLGFDDAIYFHVEHGQDGDAIVRCTDAGVGMDEYIIRNYLSVAGVSYYRSDDFRNLQLKLDPISTFGIGILSCFMVASRVEITTRRDPLITGSSEPIRLEIPAANRQFRVYTGDPSFAVGTTVTVHVQGGKLKADLVKKKPDSTMPRLMVTDYLAAIAGFVEFPVVVDEDGQRTVILHPDRSAAEAAQFANSGVNPSVRQLSKEYPWAVPFAPQDAAQAKQRLQSRSFPLSEIVGPGVEGWLTYVQTPNLSTEIDRGFHPGERDHDMLEISPPGEESVQLRVRRFYYGRAEATGISPSSRRSTLVTVYRKGVLVADAKPTRQESRFHMIGLPWPLPSLVANYTGDHGRLDVARRTLLDFKSWDETCWQAARLELCRTDIASALKLPPAERWAALAKISVMFQLSELDLAASIPISQWPVPALLSTGEITFIERPFTLGDRIFEIPEGAERSILAVLGSPDADSQPTDTESYYGGWRGADSISISPKSADRDLLNLWGWFTKWRLQKILAPISVHFLSDAYPGLSPLEQTEYVCVAEAEYEPARVWERAMRDPLALKPAELGYIRRQYWRQELEALGKATPFAPPFQHIFRGRGCLNLLHPVGKALFQCVSALRYHQSKGTAEAAVLGNLEDILLQAVEDADACPKLWQEIIRLELIPDFTASRPIERTDYLPTPTNGRWMEMALTPHYFTDGSKLHSIVPQFYRPFGHPLTSSNLEPAPEEIVTLVRSLKKKT